MISKSDEDRIRKCAYGEMCREGGCFDEFVSYKLLHVFEKMEEYNCHGCLLDEMESGYLKRIKAKLPIEAEFDFANYIMIKNARRLEENTIFFVQGYKEAEELLTQKSNKSKGSYLNNIPKP